MPIIEISSLTDSGVEIFSTLTEAQLRNRIEPDKGLFIAESPKVIHVALNAGYEPLALLCEQKHITGDAAGIIERCGDIPVYTGERKLLATLTGYTLTRGVLCAMRRRALPSAEEVCRKARRIVVIEGVVDATNIGAIFRSAAAFQDFPLRGKKVFLNLRRRRWILKSSNEYISRNWRMVAEGTRLTQDFASFLKELY